ncbi:hypothetical protein CLF_100526 [Clonorchis sinensis]|uniref:Retrotransposon gag domain-containing protein n=1 Tax=Clonorchis sinensis TaxID=79923 RepID=G7Y3N3_CLOSI|nr:hypothetical protein CLF_100526 [Clonorchis sinensis]
MEPLNVDSTAQDVEDYLERFDIWYLTKPDVVDEKLTAYFLHFVGKEAYKLIKNLVYLEPPADISYNALKKIVLQHFKPIKFVATERARFNMLTLSHSQSVRDFVLQLRTQAAKCDYGAQLEDQLLDRFIAGILLPELQQKLLLCPNKKFQTIRKTCGQYEDVKHATKTDEAVLLNCSKRNNSKMRTDNKFKHRNNFPQIHRIPSCDSNYNNSDCLLIQPLPVKRDAHVADTKRCFAPIFSTLRRNWTQQERRQFPAFYCRRESLSVTLDGLLCGLGRRLQSTNGPLKAFLKALSLDGLNGSYN